MEGVLCTLPGIPYLVLFSGILSLAISAGALTQSFCCLVTALDGPEISLVQSAFSMIGGEAPSWQACPAPTGILGVLLSSIRAYTQPFTQGHP